MEPEQETDSSFVFFPSLGEGSGALLFIIVGYVQQ